MHAQDDRDQFSPPRPPGRLRAVAMAVLVHAALMGALTLGVNWKTTVDQPAVEAELWDNVPRQAAPADNTPPQPPEPPSPPEPPPRPVPAPPPPPPPPPPRAQDKPDTREADIAIEREKKRLEQEKRERAEQQERDKRERDRREKLETEKKERLEQERKERLQKEKDKERELKEKQAEQKRAELKKQADEKRKAEEADAKRKAEAESDAKRKSEADAKRRADAQAREVDKQRAENMRRMMQGLPGATGGENATGKDKVSSGPSGSYGGKVAAKIKPNIVYPDAISGNPRAVVEVRAAPDGTIVSKKLIQSSGNKSWDEAILRALEKTETLPRDTDGRVPSGPLEIGFRPQD